MTALHQFLRIAQGVSAEQMFAELRRLQALGSWKELPTDEYAFKAGLNELLAADLAERSGKLWLWKPLPQRAGKRQAELFA